MMNKDTFSARVNAMMDTLYRVAYGQLREPQDRMDAVQDALLKAWSRRGTLRNEDYFETWLVRILINECHNHQRRRSRIAPLEAAPEPAAAADFAGDTRQAILALPEKYRVVIILHYMEGYTTDEIARILRVPRETVRTRLRRARMTLKDMLDEPDGRL